MWAAWATNETDDLNSMLKPKNERLVKADKEKLEFLYARNELSPLTIVNLVFRC
jgi:hypothetical protein